MVPLPLYLSMKKLIRYFDQPDYEYEEDELLDDDESECDEDYQEEEYEEEE